MDDKIIEEYAKTFGELPTLPKCAGYNLILDLMEDAVVSKKPVTFEQVVERLREIGEPLDIS